jgi:ribonuclease Z
LFDMGDLHRLAHRERLKITHAFVTHTHMDHFAGFDTLLRVFLGRRNSLHLFGPANFLQNIEGKLAGYTWNLVADHDNPFALTATEVHTDHTITQVYHGKNAFRSSQSPLKAPFDGALLKESAFSIHAIHLDHQIPCLAFMLAEPFHINILRDRLKRLHIPVGPWLKGFKEALYEGHDPEESFRIVWKDKGKDKEIAFPFRDLVQQIARVSPGQKVVYIVDIVFSPENAEKIIAFARHADQLFIEAAFLDEHADVARKKYHLTAGQAGALAREAQVRRFTLFHFSPRYDQTTSLFHQEALEAFAKAHIT